MTYYIKNIRKETFTGGSRMNVGGWVSLIRREIREAENPSSAL
jgi:hypothetical protein